ncbi:MAG: DUF1651 domain-containing protein [Cyanobium sp. PLM2.Bin73]|nr:MAG: DUF1651 domain-containing protein [Cyanobium sp. PLM2.Bin73]
MSSSVRAEVSVVFIQDVRRQQNWSSTNSGCRLAEPKAEVITCELLPDQEIPLLKSRRERSRAEALKLWAEKRKAGWSPCSPQW